MSDENELNESEMDQLLRELEQKSSSKPQESKPQKAEVKPKKADKAVPKKALPKEKPKKSEVATAEEPRQKPQTNGISVVQRGSSESLNRKVSIFLACLTTPLLLAAIWMLGNFLASFVSVGWLIAIVAFFAVVGLAYFFKRLVGKGRFMVWSGLVSTLLLVLMLLPATFATTKMVEFGHWPVSSITQASGLENTNVFVSFANRASRVLADFRLGFGGAEAVVSLPKELGKDLPLIPEIKPEEPVVEDGKKEPTPEEPVKTKEEPATKKPVVIEEE